MLTSKHWDKSKIFFWNASSPLKFMLIAIKSVECKFKKTLGTITSISHCNQKGLHYAKKDELLYDELINFSGHA